MFIKQENPPRTLPVNTPSNPFPSKKSTNSKHSVEARTKEKSAVRQTQASWQFGILEWADPSIDFVAQKKGPRNMDIPLEKNIDNEAAFWIRSFFSDAAVVSCLSFSLE